jgi:hypothetical protein
MTLEFFQGQHPNSTVFAVLGDDFTEPNHPTEITDFGHYLTFVAVASNADAYAASLEQDARVTNFERF